MVKLAPYFFKVCADRENVWRPLGCYHSTEEAFVDFKKRFGEKDIYLMRGKPYQVFNGKLYEGYFMGDSEFLANENLVLEMCDLTISNADKFDPRLVERARELKKQSEERIRRFSDGKL